MTLVKKLSLVLVAFLFSELAQANTCPEVKNELANYIISMVDREETQANKDCFKVVCAIAESIEEGECKSGPPAVIGIYAATLDTVAADVLRRMTCIRRIRVQDVLGPFPRAGRSNLHAPE